MWASCVGRRCALVGGASAIGFTAGLASASGHTSAQVPISRMPRQLCLAGPSGAGKSTLIGKLEKNHPGAFGFSVSHTTRKPRPGETDGVHYNFVTKDDMRAAIANNEFIEYAEVHGNLYGTSTAAVKTVQASGKICILDLDVQGVISLRKAQEREGLNPHYVFIAPPSLGSLEERLRGRGTETEESLARRLANAKGEMDNADCCDHYIINDDLHVAYGQLEAIVAPDLDAIPSNRNTH